MTRGVVLPLQPRGTLLISSAISSEWQVTRQSTAMVDDGCSQDGTTTVTLPVSIAMGKSL